MKTITIPKTQYQQILQQAKAYQKLANSFFATKLKYHVNDVVSDFAQTGIYSKEFLQDLQSGLEKSSYFKPK